MDSPANVVVSPFGSGTILTNTPVPGFPGSEAARRLRSAGGFARAEVGKRRRVRRCRGQQAHEVTQKSCPKSQPTNEPLPTSLAVRQQRDLAEHSPFAQHLVRTARLFEWQPLRD